MTNLHADYTQSLEPSFLAYRRDRHEPRPHTEQDGGCRSVVSATVCGSQVDAWVYLTPSHGGRGTSTPAQVSAWLATRLERMAALRQCPDCPPPALPAWQVANRRAPSEGRIPWPCDWQLAAWGRRWACKPWSGCLGGS